MCPGMESCAYSDDQIETHLLIEGVRDERRQRKSEMSEMKEDSPGKTIAKHKGGKSTCSSP